MIRIEIDRVDVRIRRAMSEPARGVTECGAELDNALRACRARDRAEQRAVEERIAAAAVPAQMRERASADGIERIN